MASSSRWPWRCRGDADGHLRRRKYQRAAAVGWFMSQTTLQEVRRTRSVGDGLALHEAMTVAAMTTGPPLPDLRRRNSPPELPAERSDGASCVSKATGSVTGTAGQTEAGTYPQPRRGEDWSRPPFVRLSLLRRRLPAAILVNHPGNRNQRQHERHPEVDPRGHGHRFTGRVAVQAAQWCFLHQ